MANISATAFAFLTLSQPFAPVTDTSNNTVLTNNNTPIVETIDATSNESTELMADYLDLIEKDAAINAIFESDNVVAKTQIVENLKETIQAKNEYKEEKAREAAEQAAREQAQREAEEKARQETEQKQKEEEAKRAAEEAKKAQQEALSISNGGFRQMSVCSSGATKTYMDYRKITSRSSAQWKIINQSGTISVGDDGLLYSNDGFIGVALGSYWGNIGDKFKFVLSNGQELNVIKIDEKADKDTINGCAHSSDSSVIEFVINKEKALATFGGVNGHPANGNFNNIQQFKGTIQAAYKYVG